MNISANHWDSFVMVLKAKKLNFNVHLWFCTRDHLRSHWNVTAEFNINYMLNDLLPGTSLLAPKIQCLRGHSYPPSAAILRLSCDDCTSGDARPDRNRLNQACSRPVRWYFKDSSVTYLTFFSHLNHLENAYLFHLCRYVIFEWTIHCISKLVYMKNKVRSFNWLYRLHTNLQEMLQSRS